MVPQIYLLDLFLIIAFALSLSDHECSSVLSHFSHILKVDCELGGDSASDFWERRKEMVQGAQSWSHKEKILTQCRDQWSLRSHMSCLFTPLGRERWDHRQKTSLCWWTSLSLAVIWWGSKPWALRKEWLDARINNRRAGCVLLSFSSPTLPCPKTSVTTSGVWLRIDSPLV